jgi:hypothetical protein
MDRRALHIVAGEGAGDHADDPLWFQFPPVEGEVDPAFFLVAVFLQHRRHGLRVALRLFCEAPEHLGARDKPVFAPQREEGVGSPNALRQPLCHRLH